MFSRFVALKTKQNKMFFLSEPRHAEGDKASHFFVVLVVVVLKSYSFVSRQGSAASPQGLRGGRDAQRQATAWHSALSPPRDGLSSWRHILGPPPGPTVPVPLCARQEEAGVPFSGHVLATGTPPVCERLCKINNLFWFVPSFASYPVGTVAQLRPAVRSG